MVKKALLIGIDYVNDPSLQLTSSVQNAARMKQMLMDAYGYHETDIVELRDDLSATEAATEATETTCLPTKENILSRLSQLAKESPHLEEIWFHYSGHGSQIADHYGEEVDGLEEVIVPSDFRVNGMIEDVCIFQIIRTVKCRMILVFDCTHSGTICNLQWNIDYVDGLFIKTMNSNKYIVNEMIVCFSACKDSEGGSTLLVDDSSRSQITEPPRVNFTSIFLDGLRSLDYTTDVFELYSTIRKHPQNSNQTPQLSCSNITPDVRFTKYVRTDPSVVEDTAVNPVVEPIDETVMDLIEDLVENIAINPVVESVDEPICVPRIIVRTNPPPPKRSPMAFTQTPSTIPLYYQKLSVISKQNTNPLYPIAIKKR
jgi:hypothetical protein